MDRPWKTISTPADMPPQYQAVLVSDDNTTGVAYHRVASVSPIVGAPAITRMDGWVLIWPVDPDGTFKVKKWQELPKP